MEFNSIDTDKLFKYVNLELSKDKKLSVNKLCDRIGIKRSTFKSRAKRGNYSFDIDTRQYVKGDITSTSKEVSTIKEDITSNITDRNKEVSTIKEDITSNITDRNKEVSAVEEGVTSNITDRNKEVSAVEEGITSNITLHKDIDYNKLNLLLDNLDILLKLVDRSNITSNTTNNITLESKETSVKSLRINDEVYKKIKDRANKEDTSISSIVNRALIDYLNNYI